MQIICLCIQEMLFFLLHFNISEIRMCLSNNGLSYLSGRIFFSFRASPHVGLRSSRALGVWADKIRTQMADATEAQLVGGVHSANARWALTGRAPVSCQLLLLVHVGRRWEW